MKVYAQAKVNLALDVVKKREDGYHELDMIMAPISLFNEIKIEPSAIDQISCVNQEIPESSTIHKTLALLKEKGWIHKNYKIQVTKGIPDQAGLAGSSADAAAVFNAVLDFEGVDKSLDQKIELAKCIGADVPFCLVNRFARVQGIGEKIQVIPTDWKLHCFLVKPSYGISTLEAFKTWGHIQTLKVDVAPIQKAIEDKSYISLIRTMGNALEKSAFEIRPKLEELKKELESCGFDRVMMSGSGSSLMGFSQKKECIEKAMSLLEGNDCFYKYVQIG